MQNREQRGLRGGAVSRALAAQKLLIKARPGLVNPTTDPSIGVKVHFVTRLALATGSCLQVTQRGVSCENPRGKKNIIIIIY